mgnify:CR=1 FL=1
MTQSSSCRVSSRISALEKPPFPDAADRCVHSFDLVAELLERAPVHDARRGRARSGWRTHAARPAWLPDRDVRRLTIHQDVPRNERTVVVLGRRPRPSRPAAEPGSRTVPRGGRGPATVSPARSRPIRTGWCRAPGWTCRGSRDRRDRSASSCPALSSCSIASCGRPSCNSAMPRL